MGTAAMNTEASKPGSSREVLTAISGLVVGMFVALISSTVVAPSLPRIVTELGGSQSDFTWIVTASLLAMTVATPIWGKLSDLLNRKLLVQISLIIFMVGSMLSGAAMSTLWLICSRALQGIGIGGLMALVQIVIADLISPRERGRYMGFIGAVMGLARSAVRWSAASSPTPSAGGGTSTSSSRSRWSGWWSSRRR
ncbi:MAG: MFS transporter [Propionicimonas sp.]|nr:MFS transporter [Propionicimonas sp.]MEA5117849.1 MFS transporter [Propionicimonas sp.]